MRSQRPPGWIAPTARRGQEGPGRAANRRNPTRDLAGWYRAQPPRRQRLYSLVAVISGAMLLLYALGLAGVAGRFLLLQGAVTPTPPLRVITLPTGIASPSPASVTTVTLPPTPTQLPIPATGTPTPTSTVTGTLAPPPPTHTARPTSTATATSTPTPTETATPSSTPTATETATLSPTPSETATLTSSATPTGDSGGA